MTDDTDVTIAEIKALAKVVERLPDYEQPYIYEFIKARDPEALQDFEDDSGEANIEFMILKQQTLREMKYYIASRRVNTQSEILENNPVLVRESIAQTSSSSVTLPSDKDEKLKIKPELLTEESIAACSSDSAIFPSKKVTKRSAEKQEIETIKARLRKVPRRSTRRLSAVDK